MANRVAIVGIGQTYHKSNRPDVNMQEMVGEAVRAALEDADLSIKDIEATFHSNMETFEAIYFPDHVMAAEMGGFGKPGLKVATGGTSGGSVVCEGFYMVAGGLHDVAMVIGYEKQDCGDTTAAITAAMNPSWAKGATTGAIGEFAKQALSYMKTSGAKEEHAAMIRLKADKGACRNPYSHLKLGLTSIDQVLESGYLVWPLRFLDFCPQSCGACVMIMASEEKAKKITKKPVWIADVEVVHQEPFKAGTFGDPTGTETYTQHVACENIYKRNGITNVRKDVDLAEIYEPSNWEEMNLYEHLHFCEKNEGWKLIEKGITEMDGEFPVNCSGGVIATNPIGATPVIRVAEAALQIRGDAGEHQATRDVKTAIATALGGPNWTTMALLKRSI
ncbi:MAG: thiolase family protein [Chloroflexi bacterium]|jgi:acetyl-CoA C-acetyltransferase|nr:thiolase family protein [Chloroflexota bacterium]